MSENVFKYLAIFFFIIVAWSFCTDPDERDNEYYDVNVQTMVPASDGLDLKAVGELLKKADSAEELEKLLNSPAQGVNNLDLDADGKVDYISVTEYGNDKVKGFSLTTQPASGETQELATIEVEKVSDSEGEMQIRGNEQIYGSNHYYHSHFGFTDFLIMSYLFSPHRFYSSPWGYGAYPSYYSPYRTMPYNDYRSRTGRYTSGSSFRSSNRSTINSNIKSPNAGKTATRVRAPLKNPSTSQKSFQARSRTSTRSGGFGRSSSLRRSASSRSGGFRSGK
jgi:hypothetical protein